MESIVRKRNNAELQFVIETPLRETVVVDTVPKCEAAIKQIMAYVYPPNKKLHESERVFFVF